jgi:hypothetical protein
MQYPAKPTDFKPPSPNLHRQQIPTNMPTVMYLAGKPSNADDVRTSGRSTHRVSGHGRSERLPTGLTDSGHYITAHMGCPLSKPIVLLMTTTPLLCSYGITPSRTRTEVGFGSFSLFPLEQGFSISSRISILHRIRWKPCRSSSP